MSGMNLFFQQIVNRSIQDVSKNLQLVICNDSLAGFDPADGILINAKAFCLQFRCQLVLVHSAAPGGRCCGLRTAAGR